MKSVKELLDEKAVLHDQMTDLVERATKEGREMTSDEDQQFDAINKEYEAINGKLERAQRIEKLNAEKAKEVKQEVKEKKEPEYDNVFWKYFKRGMRSLTSPEQNVLSQFRGTDPQTTTVTAGGYTIPTGFSNELSIAMAAWGGMLQVSRIVRTETGNQIDWPTVDDTATTGALLTEAGTGVVGDMTFGTKTLNSYMYYSKIVQVSVQLLQDSYFDLQSFLRDAFARRLGTIINSHATVGTGSSQPNGVVTAASVGKTSASNSTVTFAEMVDLVHSVDPAYRNNGRFMLEDASLAIIKKLSIGTSDARALWQPSWRDGTPDTIDGYPYTINQDMASFGAGNKPIAFGDFSQYVIRLAGDTTFVRLDERYMEKLLVGFLAYQRMDGELIDTNAIKVLRNPTT